MKVKSQLSSFDLEDIKEVPENMNSSHKKQNLSRMFKSAIFIFCLAGFGFQAKEILANFYSYPTVLNTAIEITRDFPTPALTYCSKFLYDFMSYCQYFTDRCKSPKNMKLFCQDHPLYCDGNNTFIVFPVEFPNKPEELELAADPSMIFPYNSAYYMEFEGPFHYYNPSTKDMEACYTFGTGLTETGLRTKTMEGARSKEWADIHADFQESGSKYMNDRDLTHGTLYIHSPFLSFKKNTKSVTIYPYYENEVYIGLEVEKLLPFPYETDCEDYEAKWRENNMTGPLSQDMCQHACLADETNYFETGFEEDKFSSYEDPCDRNGTYRNDELCNCFQDCKDECLKLNYYFSFSTSKAPKSFYKEEKKALVILFIEGNKVRFTYQRAKYMDVELFSYIGGLLGCWLGISIWTSTGIFSSGYSTLGTIIKNKRNTSRRGEKQQETSCTVNGNAAEEVA